MVLLCMLASCHRNRTVERPVPSVYYWRTVLTLDSTELDFLARHHVGRMYVRYFDVVVREHRLMPNATIVFHDTIPGNIEVIPTVFIAENCLRNNIDSVSELLVNRIVQMNETHDLPLPRQVQIDCDWTERSQETYYAFLRHTRQLLAERGIGLSATIRLHQLAMTPPPVDEGTLMVYNTGDATRGGDHNPILDYRDVQPYLRYLAKYDLPLCAAYPVFGWQLLFNKEQFKAILRSEDLADTTLFKPLSQGEYLVLQSRDVPLLNDSDNNITWLSAGDHVRVWQPSSSEVLRVARALNERRPDINSQVIIYHLDNRYLKQYETKFYETIFHL